MSVKILFIINPKAGTKSKKALIPLIRKKFAGDNCNIIYTERPGHAAEITQSAVKENFDIVVAVGGDGTINEIASVLKNSKLNLGIIALGSGNGFARHMHIPMNVEQALDVIEKNKITQTDTMMVNNFFSVNVSGIGFDARVAALFGKDGKRGLTNYVKTIIREYFNCKQIQFTIKTGNEIFTEEGIIASFCNSSQFGNNASISPLSKTDDGKAEVVILKKIPLAATPLFTYQLFRKKINHSSYIKTFSASQFEVTTSVAQPLHIDGDYKCETESVTLKVVPNSLNVIVP